MEQIKKLGWLFYINLFISAFTFGGGYVVIPMIRKYYVEQKKYFDEEELLRIAAISQSSPGAIAMNMSAIAGYRVAKLPGLLISCMASLLPPLLILAIVSAIYDSIKDQVMIAAALHGMEAGVAALIVDLIMDMYCLIYEKKDTWYSLMAPVVFVLQFVFHVSIVYLLLGCILFCVLKAFWHERKATI